MTRSTVRARAATFAAAIRRIFGMPDYAAHLAHLREQHPECALPTEREFFDEYLAARERGGVTRCC
ncbi:MAG: YbdD/YjiX family protein [Gemmatimonadota bacterium]